jgi:hypothetical protein
MELGMMYPLMDMKINDKIRWHGVPKVKKFVLIKMEADLENKVMAAQIKVEPFKMTRKRFERVLMALGVHAIHARELSGIAKRIGIPYLLAFDAFCKAVNEKE